MKKFKRIFLIILLIIAITTSIIILLNIKNLRLNNIIKKEKQASNKLEKYENKGIILTAELNEGREEGANNTKYLQELINIVSDNGGGIIKIPAGTYYFTQAQKNSSGMGYHAIMAKNNVIIEGAGTDESDKNKCTILKPSLDVEITKGRNRYVFLLWIRKQPYIS